MKSYGTMEGVYINGAPQGITSHETDNFTLYPASIISINKNRFTKHYFIGDKRVASRIGTGLVERSLGIPIYFARPYRSTDKPHIEHANALIRQYLPKHASFAKLTTKEIKDIECALNNRPRKKLGYRTPHEVFYLNLQNECCTS